MSEQKLSQISQFFKHESFSAILLVAATTAALVLANSAIAPSYHSMTHSVHFLVNDVLMVVFFLVVGLEIRREIQDGELSDISKSIVPIGAAVGGMCVPALLFAGCTFGTESVRGWGIPMATDIAFALGAMSLLGSRVPAGLKIFLTSLAIVDDIGAILVIALFYSTGLELFYLGATAAFVLIGKRTQALLARSDLLFAALAALIWYCVYASGIHATIAGIILAFLVPRERADLYEHKLHPLVAYGIMPVFALTNAGVAFSLSSILNAAGQGAFQGVFWGLVVGKPLGIMAAVWLLVAFFKASLPEGVFFRHVFGASLLAGIGFTMSIFIAGLAIPQELDVAKAAILVASLAASILGIVSLFACKPLNNGEA